MHVLPQSQHNVTLQAVVLHSRDVIQLTEPGRNSLCVTLTPEEAGALVQSLEAALQVIAGRNAEVILRNSA